MALDRSKFKSTVVATVVEQDKELASSLGRDGGSYTKYIKFEDGENLIRIYPPHPEEDGGGDVFAEAKVTTFLPMMVVEKDNNRQDIMENGRPKLKESVRSVFNSRIHGNTPMDLVEEYIKMASENLEEDLKVVQDPVAKSQIVEKLNRIKGNYALKIQGIGYKQAWVMYIDRIVGQSATFGPIEIGPAVKDRLNAIAASSDSANNPLATDPFTDLDNGRAVKVFYNKSASKPQDYYKAELDNVLTPTVIAGQTYNLPRTFPITDEQLEAFNKVTPLAKRFKNCFTRRDFELQFEGLSFFDKKHGINLFQNSAFIDVCEQIDAYYPEIEEEAEKETSATHHATTPLDNVQPIKAEAAPVPVVEENVDQFTMMSRKELGDWCKLNKVGLLIKPTLSDENIRDHARQWLAGQDAMAQMQSENYEEYASEVTDEQLEAAAPVEEQQTTTQTTVTDRLAAMKAKAGIS
jgi:hypothetical protein